MPPLRGRGSGSRSAGAFSGAGFRVVLESHVQLCNVVSDVFPVRLPFLARLVVRGNISVRAQNLIGNIQPGLALSLRMTNVDVKNRSALAHCEKDDVVESVEVGIPAFEDEQLNSLLVKVGKKQLQAFAPRSLLLVLFKWAGDYDACCMGKCGYQFERLALIVDAELSP